MTKSFFLTFYCQLIEWYIHSNIPVGFVFYSCCLFCGLLFLFLAQKWKYLATIWYRSEKIFLHLPYKECGWKLSTKIRLTAGTILFFAIGKWMKNRILIPTDPLPFQFQWNIYWPWRMQLKIFMQKSVHAMLKSTTHGNIIF